MFSGVRKRERPNLLGNEAGEAFVQRHAQRADALWAKSARSGEHEVGAIGFEQVDRTDIRLESTGDESDYVAEGFRRLAAIFGEVPNFLQSQNVLRVARIYRLAQARLPHMSQVTTPLA